MAEEKPQAEGHSEERHMIPVWFFVGVLLFIYGILILIQGVAEWSTPPHTVLSNLHPTVWWSFILIILGAIFTVKHFPKKNS
jgi:FtsH-binding integral membrane protein